MHWAKRIILLTLFLVGQKAVAESPFLVNFGDDLWSSDLLVKTCPQELGEAIEVVVEHYATQEIELVAVLPPSLGYQYFKVEFKGYKGGELIDLESPLIYQFQYWTHRDRHERCLKVEPYNIAN